MKTGNIPDGVWPVMLTPFSGSGQIDFQGLEQLIDWYIDQGVAGLFSACLSSESLQMDDAKKLELAKFVAGYVDGRVPVVAGVMGVADRSKRIGMAQEVVGAGAEAAVFTLCDIVPEMASDEEWIEEMERHLEKLQDLPLGLYECPVPYHRMLTPTLTDYVVQRKAFRFLKETSADIDEIGRKSRAGTACGLKVFSADALSILSAYKCGASGFCGLQANLWPELHVELFDHWKANPERAETLQRFFREQDWALSRSYPASAKLYLQMAHGLEIGTTSFLNQSAVGTADREWVGELAESVEQIKAGSLEESV